MKKYLSLVLVLVLGGNVYAEVRFVDKEGREAQGECDLFDGTWTVLHENGSFYGIVDMAGRVTDQSGVLVAKITIQGGRYCFYPEHPLDILHRRMFGQQNSDAVKDTLNKWGDNLNAAVNKPFTMVGDAASAVGEAVKKPVVAVQEAIGSAGQAISSASQSVGDAIQKPFVAVGDMISGASDKIMLVFWLVVGAIGSFVCLCVVGILSRMIGAASRIISRKE